MKTAKEMNIITTTAKEAEEKQYSEMISRIIEQYIAEPVESSAKRGYASVTIDNLPERFYNYHEEIAKQLCALGYKVHKCNSMRYVIMIGWGE